MVNVQKIKENSEEFNNTHKFLAEEILIPNVNKCDAVRINMFTNHIPQALVLANGEYPNVHTNFEDQVGKYSISFKKSDRDWKIVKKIQKNKMNSTMILVDKDKNVEIINFKPSERITERYGYRLINNAEKKKVGETIKKDEIIYRSTAHNEDMHFGYGVNLKACYIAWNNLTYEDAIVLSKSAKKKLDVYSPDEFDVTLNKNDILLNLYGDDNNYKVLPDIGEKVNKNRIACSRRRLSYESILFDLNSSNIRKVNYDTDTLFYVSKGSVITDIDVFCNSDLEYLKQYPYYNQIVKYLEMNTKYYNELISTLEKYINNKEYHCSDDVKYYYKRACEMVDERTSFKFDGNTFDNIVLKIKTLSINPVVIGSKLTGRYGKN